MNKIEFDKLNPTEKKRRFHLDHGSEMYRDKNQTTCFYEDGAILEDNHNPELCVYHFPPDPESEDGEHKLYWRKLMFYRLKLRRAVSEFDELNTRLAHSMPMDEEQALAELRRLQEVVEERKELVAKAEKVFANTRISKRDAEWKAAEDERKRRFVEFQSKRSAIKV